MKNATRRNAKPRLAAGFRVDIDLGGSIGNVGKRVYTERARLGGDYG